MTFWKWENIPRHDHDPYLIRLIIFRCSLFGIMLHWFVGSDDECLHSHPWPFVTFILKGGYWEWIPADDQTMYRIRHEDQLTDMAPDGTPLTGTWYSWGSVLFRPADWVHRVEYDPDNKAVTLVFHGRKCREWGFETKQGWKHHTEYSYSKHCS